MLDEVHQACEILEAFAKGDIVVEREQVVAYARIQAYCDHWPSRAGADLRQLLTNCHAIYERETSRCIKQRRIAIAQFARALST